jgi:drug/metabolite transporter (DMT)-like permease
MQTEYDIMSEHHHSVLSAIGGGPAVRLGALAPSGVERSGPLRWLGVTAGASGYLWGLGAAVIWSGWWTVTRMGVADGLPAADLAAVRFGISGFLLLPLAWRERQAIRPVAARLLFFMAVGAGAPYALVAGTGVRLASAGVGGAITVGLLPVFTLILSVLILRERVTRGLAAGIACILLGAACVSAGAWDVGRGGYGLAFFVAGALMWAGYTVALRRAGLRPLTATAVVCVASLALYTPVWLVTSGPARLLAAAPADLLLQALYQSLLSAVGALYCFGRAVGRLGATRASVFAAIVPAFSVIIAAIVLRESPRLVEICGALLLSAGAILAARSQPNGR